MSKSSTKAHRSRTNEAPNQRQRRGLELAKLKHQFFRRSAEDTWLVPSATITDSTYVVDVSHETCTCPDFAENGEMCKHLWAVMYVQNKITLLDGTRFAPPPVTKDEDSETPISAQGAS